MLAHVAVTASNANRKMRRTALVLLGSYLALTVAAFFFGELYGSAWLPLLRIECGALLPDWLTGAVVKLLARNGQHLVELHVVTAKANVFPLGELPANIGLHSSTLQAYLTSHPVLIFSVLAAWPVESTRQRLVLLALGGPCVLVTTSLDIPFVLVGQLQDLILDNLAP